MHIDVAIKKLEQFLSSFDTEMMKISERLAMDTKALIVHRIQSEGIGKKYSTNKIPAYLLLIDEGNLDTQQAINYVKSVEDDPEGDGLTNWSEVRIAHGNQVAFVDLTYTGRMFMNLGIIKTDKVGDRYITTIGGFDEEVRKKLHWNALRYGDFFKVDPEDKKILSISLDEQIISLQNKYFGA